MSLSLDTILPSISSLGILGYWVIGAASALEAYFLTGVVVPGTLVVDAGGIIVQRGGLDFWDLVWFVAAGSVLGAEAGYWTGRFARKRLTGRWAVQSWPAYARAARLFARRGGMALVLGRFAGPVAGLVPLVAALTGMERRRFLLWSVAGSIPYAIAHVAFGYFLGNVLTRMGPNLTRMAVIFGVVAVILAVLIWVVWRVIRLMPRVLPIGSAVLATIAVLPAVERLRARHPRMTTLVGRRLSTDMFTGLPLTALGVIFVYILTVWLDGVFEFLHADPILQVDLRLAELIHSFWNPGLIQLAAHVTALGDPRVVTALFLAALVWVSLLGRRDLAMGLAFSVLGDVASVNLLKRLFDRPRPVMAYFAESSNSFPSGHAAISLAFYGMVCFVLWRTRRLGPLASAFLAALLAAAIGLSRLYLIEHYLTDVLNGWLVGGLWLVAGITLAGWWHHRRPSVRPHPSARRRALAGLAILCLIFSAGWMTARYDKALAVPIRPDRDVAIASVDALFADPSHPTLTESLFGNPLEPINVVIAARDAAALDAAMVKAGWNAAQLPSPRALGVALWALVTNVPDLSAPVTPYFWHGVPNAFAYERPASAGGPRERHHVRFWDAGAELPDGRRVFVGAASFDDGLDRSLLHHIAPDIDAERDQLARDLSTSGAASLQSRLEVSGPRLGTSIAGDPWFSDGMAAVLSID